MAREDHTTQEARQRQLYSRQIVETNLATSNARKGSRVSNRREDLICRRDLWPSAY